MKLQTNVSLKEKSSFRLIGTAKYWAELDTVEDIIETFEWIQKKKLKFFILGEGSNTVVANNWDGILLHPNFPHVEIKVDNQSFTYSLPTKNEYLEFLNLKQDKDLLKITNSHSPIHCIVESGIHWDSFIYFCLIHGILGLEALSGIPGKVGAVPIQNVGAYGEEVKNFITKVEAWDIKTLEKKAFYKEDCEFNYRNSFFKKHLNQFLIYKVHFSFLNSAKEIQYEELKKYYNQTLSNLIELNQIKEKIQNKIFNSTDRIFQALVLRYSVYQLRRKKGMILENNIESSKNLGSFFLNPFLEEKEFKNLLEKINKENPNLGIPFFKENQYYKIPAAWLIEFSGFYKGYKENGFQISPKHSLCIINLNGNQENLKKFIKKIQDTVYKKTNILLKPEPIFMENFL